MSPLSPTPHPALAPPRPCDQPEKGFGEKKRLISGTSGVHVAGAVRDSHPPSGRGMSPTARLRREEQAGQEHPAQPGRPEQVSRCFATGGCSVVASARGTDIGGAQGSAGFDLVGGCRASRQ